MYYVPTMYIPIYTEVRRLYVYIDIPAKIYVCAFVNPLEHLEIIKKQFTIR